MNDDTELESKRLHCPTCGKPWITVKFLSSLPWYKQIWWILKLR